MKGFEAIEVVIGAIVEAGEVVEEHKVVRD